MGAWLRDLRDESERWCQGRLAAPRAVLLIWLLWILIYLWRDPPMRRLFDFPNMFSGINLGIHELGHVIFRPFGAFLGILGGSLTQCLAPIAGVFILRRQDDFFGMTVCGGWLSTNLFGVGTYMADARVRQLPLVSPFSGHPLHDWNYLFGRMGLLGACTTIGVLTKVLATLVMLGSLAAGAWLLWTMHTSDRRGQA